MALDGIKNLGFGFVTNYDEQNGVNLNLINNFSDFGQILQNIVSKIGNDAAKVAIDQLYAKIDESNNEYLKQATSFLGIEQGINLQNANLTSIQKTLDSKKAEIEKEIRKRTEEAAGKAINDALGNSAAGQAASEALKNLPSVPIPGKGSGTGTGTGSSGLPSIPSFPKKSR